MKKSKPTSLRKVKPIHKTKLRQLTPEQEREMAEMFTFGSGAGYVCHLLEELFQSALLGELKDGEVTRNLCNGYFQMRQVIKLLCWLDPYQNPQRP